METIVSQTNEFITVLVVRFIICYVLLAGEDIAYVADCRRDTSSREVLRHEVGWLLLNNLYYVTIRT